MRKRNKIILISAIVSCAVILAGYGFVTAFGPRGFGGKAFYHGFHGRGFHPMSHGGDVTGLMLKMLDFRMKSLDLTDEQEVKYNGIRERLKVKLEEGIEAHKSMKEQAHDVMDQKRPDIPALAGLFKDQMKLMSGLMEKGVDLMVELYEVLDEDQQKQLLDKFREREAFHRFLREEADQDETHHEEGAVSH